MIDSGGILELHQHVGRLGDHLSHRVDPRPGQAAVRPRRDGKIVVAALGRS